MSIPLVQNNEKDSINTSIIAIKRNIERINMLLGLSNSEEIDTSEFVKKSDIVDVVEAGNMNPVTSNAVVPVDEVTSGNMQSVTSGAVYEKLQDYQEGEWKTLEGNNISNLDYKELAISVWFYYNDNEILYSHQFTKGMLGGNQVLAIGGYFFANSDYGVCNVNNNNGVITLRNVYYAGNNYTATASLKIRYR